MNPRARDHIATSELNRAAPGMTDQEIADRFGVSKACIFYDRLRAIAKIRKAVLADPELRQLAAEVCGHDLEEAG